MTESSTYTTPTNMTEGIELGYKNPSIISITTVDNDVIERQILIKEKSTSDGKTTENRPELKEDIYNESFFQKVIGCCGNCLLWTFEKLQEYCSIKSLQLIAYPMPGMENLNMSQIEGQMTNSDRNHEDNSSKYQQQMDSIREICIIHYCLSLSYLILLFVISLINIIPYFYYSI